MSQNQEKGVVLPHVSSVDAKSEGQILKEDGGQNQKPKKNKAKTYTHLTMDQEDAMFDWLKNNEVLYNKKLEGYKDTKKKALLWTSEKTARTYTLLGLLLLQTGKTLL